MVRDYHPEKIPQVYNFDEIPGKDVREGVHQKVFRGFNQLLGFTTLEPGMEPGPHSHPWEQVAVILEGSCDFTVGTETFEVEAGDLFVIPPGTEHYGHATDETCLNMDVWPLREDYLPRSDYQNEFVTYDTD